MGSKQVYFHDFYRCFILVIGVTQFLAKNGVAGNYESRKYETDNSGSTGKTYGSFDGPGLDDSNDKKKSAILSSSGFSEGSGKKDEQAEPLFGVKGSSGKRYTSDIFAGEDYGSSKGNSGVYLSGASVGKNSDSYDSFGGGSDSYDNSPGLSHKKIADYGESVYTKSSGNYGAKSTGYDGAQGYDGGDVKSGGSVSVNKGIGTIDYGAKYSGKSGLGAKSSGESPYRDSDLGSIKGYGTDLTGSDESGYGDDSYGSESGYGHKQLGSQSSAVKGGDYGSLLSKPFDIGAESDKRFDPETIDTENVATKQSSKAASFEEEEPSRYKPNSGGKTMPASDKGFTGERSRNNGKGASSKTSGISGKDFKGESSGDSKGLYGEEASASKSAGDFGSVKSEYASDESAYNGGGGRDADSYSNKFYGGIKPGYAGKTSYGSDDEGGYGQGASGKQAWSGGGYKSSQSYEGNGEDSNGVLDSQSDYDAVEEPADPSVCKKETEFAPHPTQCNKFYQCANGKPFMIICPQGLLFNSKHHVCDWPSNVDCPSDSDIPVLHLPSSRHPRDMLAKTKSSKTPPSPPPKPIQSPPPQHQSKPPTAKSEPVKLQSMSEYSSGEESIGSSSHSENSKKSGEEEENDVSYYVTGDEGSDYEATGKGDDWGKTSYSAPAQGSSSQEGVCSSGVKYIRHSSDCTKFFQCAHSKPFLMSCPAGLHFNTDLDVCDWPSNVDCYGSSKTRQSNGYDYESSYSENQPSYHKESRSTYYTPTVYSSSSYSGEDSSKSQESHQKPTYESDRSSGSSYPSGGQPTSGFFPMSLFHYPVMPVFHPPIFQPIIPYYPKQTGSQSSTSSNNDKGDTGDDDGDDDEKDSGEPSKKESQDSSDSKYYQDDSSQSNDQKQTSDDSSYQQGFKDGYSTKIYKRPQKTSPSITNNKGFYYYDYDSASNSRYNHKQSNNYNNNRKGETGSNQKGIYYYYYDNSNKNGGSGKQGGDYAYYYDYDTPMNSNSNYDYFMYDYGGKAQDYGTSYGHGSSNHNKRKLFKNGVLSQPQYFGGAFKELSKNKNLQQSLKKINDVNEDVEYVHFDHTGSGSGKGQSSMSGGGDLSSILPLILLGSAQGQQLILTSALLSKLKGVSNSMGGKGGSLIDTKGLLGGGGSKGGDSLLKTIFLLRLLSPQTTTTTTTGTGTTVVPTPNIQFANPGFVTIAGGAPVVFVDPVTGQVVPDTQVAVDPISGAVFDITTNRVLLFPDPTTGQLVQAFAAPVTTVPLATGRSFTPVTNVISRTLTRNPLTNLLGGRNTHQNVNNRLISVIPGPTVTPTSGAAPGRDPINLIFLSPLTPSSLPPPIQSNDGSATMIRGSLRDILGEDLSRFLNNAQLVPGQGLPNSPAGSQRTCTVLRSGETVPYRVNPRAGRTLTTEECQAMGQLLDKFIPTFLQNFVPSDAAFAGFGSNSRNNNNNRVTPLQPTPSSSSSSTTSDASVVNDIFGGGLNTVSPSFNRPDGSSASASNLSQFINIRNDRNGCTISVPNIVPQC